MNIIKAAHAKVLPVLLAFRVGIVPPKQAVADACAGVELFQSSSAVVGFVSGRVACHHNVSVPDLPTCNDHAHAHAVVDADW